MSLIKLVLPYKQNKDSGLLSVKVEGQEYLVKIYFDQGLVVGLSMGATKNEACLKMLGDCKVVNATFMRGYKNPDFVVADASIDNKLAALFAAHPDTNGAATGKVPAAMMVRAAELQSLEQEVINIMGPIGKVLVDAAYLEIGCKQGADMQISLYGRLIERLKEDLPVQHRSAFVAKYGAGGAGKHDQ